jgi:hypothetical protein
MAFSESCAIARNPLMDRDASKNLGATIEKSDKNVSTLKRRAGNTYNS